MSKILFAGKNDDMSELYDYIDENKTKFYRIAFTYAKNENDAMDIVQESIYKAIVNYNKLKNKEYMRTWFYRILINCSIDVIRKNKKITYIEDEQIEIEASDWTADDNIDLYRTLDLLDENQRSIIVLRFFEDMKIEDIAKVINCNPNTAKTRLYAALKKMKIEMEK